MVTDAVTDEHAPSTARRAVLLGASNLTRGLPTVIQVCESVWGTPLEIFAAIGHGRSFGATACVFGRTLPGILQSGLWTALAQQPPLPTAALITDVGNDIFYGAVPEQIADWVDQCVARLQNLHARVVLTRLPVDNLPLIRDWQFSLFRRLFFPFCQLSFQQTKDRVQAVDQLLCQIAQARGVSIIEQQSNWYGLDPIHITRAQCNVAYHGIMRAWNPTDSASTPRCSSTWSHWWNLQRMRPEQQWFLGREQQQSQPCARLKSGATLHFF